MGKAAWACTCYAIGSRRVVTSGHDVSCRPADPWAGMDNNEWCLSALAPCLLAHCCPHQKAPKSLLLPPRRGARIPTIDTHLLLNGNCVCLHLLDHRHLNDGGHRPNSHGPAPPDATHTQPPDLPHPPPPPPPPAALPHLPHQAPPPTPPTAPLPEVPHPSPPHAPSTAPTATVHSLTPQIGTR